MLKRLAILGLLVACISGAWSQVPRNGDQQKQPAQSKDGSRQPVAQPCICTVKVENAPAKQANEPQQKPSEYPWRELYSPANVPNWLLALVAGWAGILAYRTLNAINRQAYLMDKQITLQLIAMSQWVNVEPIGTVTPRTFEGNFEVTFQFVVRNRTDYLLTIKKIVAEVFTGGKATFFTVSCDVPIPPEKSGAVGGHPFYVSANVSRYTWDTDGQPFIISGDVTFLDCMRVEQNQTFQGFFRGYADGRLVEKKPSGIVPDVKDYKPEEQEPQEAN